MKGQRLLGDLGDGRLNLLLDRLGDELDDNDLGVVTLPATQLHDAGVAAIAVSPHTLLGLLEDLANELLVAELGDGQTAAGKVAPLGPGDDLINIGTNGLGSRLDGLDWTRLFFIALVWLASVPSFIPFFLLCLMYLISSAITNQR